MAFPGLGGNLHVGWSNSAILIIWTSFGLGEGVTNIKRDNVTNVTVTNSGC